MTIYTPASPYGRTSVIGERFLGYYVHRTIPAADDDMEMTVTLPYVNRPDRIAREIYGTDDLWWVIPQRNGLEDPIYGITLGRVLIVPSRQTVFSVVR